MSEQTQESEAPGRQEDEQESELSQVAELALGSLKQLFRLMRARARAKLRAETEDRVELSVSGIDASMLVGKKGQTLDAIQYLVNRMVGKRVGEHKLIVIDSAGYRERREASLIELAKRLGEKARAEGKIVALNPMSARDRRVIHMTLRDAPDLSTRSEGDGEERRLLIVPEV
jgi:spoIIIJ-associated protein